MGGYAVGGNVSRVAGGLYHKPSWTFRLQPLLHFFGINVCFTQLGGMGVAGVASNPIRVL